MFVLCSYNVGEDECVTFRGDVAMTCALGKILVIANPAAQSGRGDKAADQAVQLLRDALGQDSVVLAKTAGPRHASDIAERASGCDSIVALGGDGVIHEVVQGLMKRSSFDRPHLGIIPVGSGNDFARALHMPTNIHEAVAVLLAGQVDPIDVGWVNNNYFIETLSFGLDAAIALDTMERRKKTGRAGTLLYAEAGIYQLTHNLKAYAYKASFDGSQTQTGESITFAVQNGPFYGGGFKICPDAQLDDGAFDICIAHPPVTLVKALMIFARAKNGGHVSSKNMELLRANTLHIEFDEEPPAQIDGEQITGRTFDIRLERAALQVIKPRADEAFCNVSKTTSE